MLITFNKGWRCLVKALATAIFGLLTFTAYATGEFKGLGYADKTTYNNALGVSADGRVVVGERFNGSNWEAFRWSGGTMTNLGTIANKKHCIASHASTNGSVIAGFCTDDDKKTYSAFRWSGGVITYLGSLGAKTSCTPNAVSGDGKVVVGKCESTAGQSEPEAFRWESGVMTGIGYTGMATHSVAFNVSNDGKDVFGVSGFELFRWSNGNSHSLGKIQSKDAFSVTDQSVDGKVVVGYRFRSSGLPLEAMYWNNGVATVLGGIADKINCNFMRVSQDGKVVIGVCDDGKGSSDAFRWTQSTNMQNLKQWLTTEGVSVPTNWKFYEPRGLNTNGNIVVGKGTADNIANQGWIARVDPIK